MFQFVILSVGNSEKLSDTSSVTAMSLMFYSYIPQIVTPQIVTFPKILENASITQ